VFIRESAVVVQTMVPPVCDVLKTLRGCILASPSRFSLTPFIYLASLIKPQ
jgi:hypothetical protein